MAGKLTPQQRERRVQRMTERLLANGAYAGSNALAETAERIRRETAEGKPWQPWVPKA